MRLKNFICPGFFFYFFLFSVYTLSAQKKMDDSEKLIRSGVVQYNKGNYIKTIEFLTKAVVLIDKNDPKKLFTVKNTIGICYGYLSNYGEALSTYSEAMKIAEDNNLIEDQINVMCNIGILYSLEYDFKSAIDIYEKAITTANKIDSNYSKTLLAVNISDVYNQLGDYKKAQFYLNSVKKLKKTKQFDQLWNINYAESLLIQGKVAESYRIMKQLELTNPVDLSCSICVIELLSKIYDAKNDINMAIAYANKGIAKATDKSDKLNLYNHLSLLYAKKKEFDKALKYKDSVIMTKDLVSVSINRGLFESNKVKLKVQEYQDEIKVKTEKQQKLLYLFISSLFIVAIVCFLIYRGLNHKIARQEQEKVIAGKQQQIITLELEGLKNNVAEKNRKLSAKALYLSGRNELIEEVMNSLSDIPEVIKNKQVLDYVKTLKSYLKSDEEWDDFITYFEQVNPEFIKTLTSNFPDLNSADIRFLCYIYMNLDVKEIGNIYNITYNAAVKRLRRIKEKMKFDKEMSFHEYLVTLH